MKGNKISLYKKIDFYNISLIKLKIQINVIDKNIYTNIIKPIRFFRKFLKTNSMFFNKSPYFIHSKIV